MKIKTGYIYHIKDEYFDYVNGDKLMINHEKGHSRPTYYVIKDGDILWFIPLSSRVDKYQKIIDEKINKYGECRTIMIRKIANKDAVILLQNAFPTLEKYISHPHVVNGKVIKATISISEEILDNFRYMLSMKHDGTNLFFTDIDTLKEMMLNELYQPN